MTSNNWSVFAKVIGLIALAVSLSACVTQPQKNASLIRIEDQFTEIVSSHSPDAHAFANQIYTYKSENIQSQDAKWSWGDGSQDTIGSSVSKVWRKAGTYIIKLSASLNGKLVNVSQTINVAGAPISVGVLTGCAITQSSGVHCWGDSNYGFEAYGDFVRGSNHIAIKDLVDVTSVSRSQNYSCAVKSDKTASCWGYVLTDNPNVAPEANYRELRLPSLAANLTEVAAISSAINHTCALKTSGQVLCWGDNKFGQLGDGTLRRSYKNAVLVTGLSDAASLSSNGFHSCALKTSGAVVCWGNNSFGQLGDGSLTHRPNAVTVEGLSDAVALSVGLTSSCAIKIGGSVVCWGGNNRGQLGDGSIESKSTPTTVFGLADAVAISTGYSHSCALKSNSRTVCWGSNDHGQLGDGSRVQKNTPAIVDKMPDATAISAGEHQTCVLTTTGKISCWGNNKSRALSGNLKDRSEYLLTPVSVTDRGSFLR